MKQFVAAAAAVFVLALGGAQAASLISKHQARAKAIDVLKGDPYGKAPAEVARNIKGVKLARDGNTKACGAKSTPAWEFHVVVRTADREAFRNGIIDGYLALDAHNGNVLCANLPLLD